MKLIFFLELQRFTSKLTRGSDEAFRLRFERVKRVLGFARVRNEAQYNYLPLWLNRRKGRCHDEHDRMEYRQREGSDAMYLASLIYIYRENDR